MYCSLAQSSIGHPLRQAPVRGSSDIGEQEGQARSQAGPSRAPKYLRNETSRINSTCCDLPAAKSSTDRFDNNCEECNLENESQYRKPNEEDDHDYKAGKAAPLLMLHDDFLRFSHTLSPILPARPKVAGAPTPPRCDCRWPRVIRGIILAGRSPCNGEYKT